MWDSYKVTDDEYVNYRKYCQRRNPHRAEIIVKNLKNAPPFLGCQKINENQISH